MAAAAITLVRHRPNRSFSYLYRSADPWPTDNYFVCHTVALTSMRLSQHRQPFSALVCPDSVLDNGPNYRQMHHQRPAKQQKKHVIQPINSYEIVFAANVPLCLELLRPLVRAHEWDVVRWPMRKWHHLYPE